jgi:hypothetical protein
MSEVATAAVPAAVNTAPNVTAQAKTDIPPASAALKEAAPKLFDVTIDGKVHKMTESELIREASLGRGAEKRFDEASQMRRQAEQLLGRLRDPKEAIKLLNDPQLGLDKNQIREAFEEWYSENVIKPSEMSPEQRKLHEANQRLAEYEKREQERKQKEEHEQMARMDAETAQKLQKEIIELADSSGLPKTRFTISRIAHWMRVNEAKELNAPKELILEQVRKEMRDVVGSLTEASEGEMLIKILGEGTIKKLRAYDLAQIRAKKGLAQPQVQQEEQPRDRSKKTSVHEWRKNLRNWS